MFKIKGLNDMVKKFKLTKDGITRLKTIGNVSNKCLLSRSIFLKDDDNSSFIRADVQDIPDDFEMGIYDISSFLATYKMFESAYIDYTDLETKKCVNIVNDTINSKSAKMEYFKYMSQEEVLMINNANIESEKKMITKMGNNLNSFTMDIESIKKILKAGNILNGNNISFTPVEDGSINIKVINTKFSNSNEFEMSITDSEIKNINSSFNLNYSLFSKLDITVDEYEVSYCEIKNNIQLIRFSNGEDLHFYFTKNNERGNL